MNRTRLVDSLGLPYPPRPFGFPAFGDKPELAADTTPPQRPLEVPMSSQAGAEEAPGRMKVPAMTPPPGPPPRVPAERRRGGELESIVQAIRP